MTSREALQWLYSAQKFGIKLGLENIKSLLSLLELPGREMRFLHVAGTNGKGSVCAFLDSILRTEGYKTGLFTSPHLVKFQERIRVQGRPISLQMMAKGLTLLKELSNQIAGIPTFFELTTALALWYFSQKKVEIVVWETGLGGRWDATNTVAPLVSVLTPISFDHKEWLGDTLTKIAFEKAGIFKFQVPAVSAPQNSEVAQELHRVAHLEQVPLSFIEKPWTVTKIGLEGTHQEWNAALAVEAIRASSLTVSPHAIHKGLASVQWPGRFQRLSPRLIIDGAHNPAGICTLVATWNRIFGTRKACVIFGSLRDKESEEMLSLLSDIAKEFLFVPLENSRSQPTAKYQVPQKIPCQYFENSKAALNAALTKKKNLVLITGSLFLIGEILAQRRKIFYQKSDQ